MEYRIQKTLGISESNSYLIGVGFEILELRSQLIDERLLLDALLLDDMLVQVLLAAAGVEQQRADENLIAAVQVGTAAEGELLELAEQALLVDAGRGHDLLETELHLAEMGGERHERGVELLLLELERVQARVRVVLDAADALKR